MKDERKTKEELISELKDLRRQIEQQTNAVKKDDCLDYELQRYKLFSDYASDLVYFCDTEGNIIYVNRIFEKLTGHKPEDFEGKSFASLFDEKNLNKAIEVYKKTLKGESPEYELSFCKTGVVCEYKNFPFRNRDGKVIGVVGIARDVTERRKKEKELEKYRKYLEDLAARRSEELEKKILEYQRAEKTKEMLKSQLMHSQKMEAIGRLAGGIAHDFNNILTAIKNFSYVGIKRTSGRDNETAGIFEQIQSVSFRAINLTRQLLTFSQKEFTNIINIDINKVINDMIALLNNLIGEDITIITNLDTGPWNIKGDVGKLEQVLTNLVINARDAITAMKNTGTITIQTGNSNLDKEACKKIPYSPFLIPGRFIHISVKDTGAGITEENMNHIFEPFFTTKKGGTGAGLGLSVVYGIIKDHQGWINVSSKEGYGTTFDIYLPAIEEDAGKITNDKLKTHDLKGAGERILLIEDDTMVRSSTNMSLLGEGYIVFEAEDAGSALNIFHKEGGRFHLVMSDLVLPDKDGLTLIEELLALNPNLKAILNSGYIDKPIDQSKLEKYGIVFFNKPYDMQDILIAIKNLLKPH